MLDPAPSAFQRSGTSSPAVSSVMTTILSYQSNRASGCRRRRDWAAARASRVLFRSDDAPRHARNPDLAVLLERPHLRNGVCANPLPRRFADVLKRRNRERDALADHRPVLLGRPGHEFDVDIPLGNLA